MKNHFLLLVSLVVFWGCEKKSSPKENTAVNDLPVVQVVQPSYQNQTAHVTATGKIVSDAELKLAFKVGGYIQRTFVQEGQEIRAGQLLAELDISEIQAQVKQAKAALAKAERDYLRAKQLGDEQAILPYTVQDAQTALEVSKEQLKVAEFNQKWTRIYAPKSGRILRQLAQEGELVTPFSPVFLLSTGTNTYFLRAGVTDKDLVKLRIGQTASVQLDAYPGELFEGNITQIGAIAHPATGLFDIEIKLKNSSKLIRSGFIGQATLQNATETAGLVIPIETLVGANQNEGYVFVYESATQKVRKTAVQLGALDGKMVQVKGGIQRSDFIVDKGANFLSDQEKVTISNPIQKQ